MTHSDIKSIEAMEKALRIKPINTHDLLGRLTNIKQAQKKKEDEEEERRLVQEMIRELKPRVLGEHDDDIPNLLPSDDDASVHSSQQARKRKLSDDEDDEDEDEEDEKPIPAKKQRADIDLTKTKTYTAVCKSYICKCRKCGKDIQYKNGDKRGLNTHHNGCALASQRYVFVEDDYSRHNRDGDIHRDEVMKSFHMTLNGETASRKKY